MFVLCVSIINCTRCVVHTLKLPGVFAEEFKKRKIVPDCGRLMLFYRDEKYFAISLQHCEGRIRHKGIQRKQSCL
jgi:hypothetical protein